MCWSGAMSLCPTVCRRGTVVRVPLQKAVIYSSVHCGLMEELGALSAVGGVCDLRYIDLPYVKEGCRTGRIADFGQWDEPGHREAYGVASRCRDAFSV